MEGAPKAGKIGDTPNDSTPSLIQTSLITAQKKEDRIKDPRRVAAGKKLAEISKQAKAKKKAERDAAGGLTEDSPKLLQMPSMAATVSIGSLALTAVGVYCGYKACRGKAGALRDSAVGLTEEAPLQPRGLHRPRSQLDSLE